MKRVVYRLPGEASFNKLYANYKNGARYRNREFSLTKEEFKNLVTQSCHYCSIKPNQTITAKRDTFTYNGIDRKNNDLGYIIDNCVPCCGPCNTRKLNKPYENFKVPK